MTAEELYLKHHGVKGQSWGKRNGPPYPLDAEGKASLREQRREKRLNKYKQKESELSDKKWDKSINKARKEIERIDNKGMKAFAKGDMHKVQKLDEKYVNAQRLMIGRQAIKALENKKIMNLSYEQMKKEKRKVGAATIRKLMFGAAGGIAVSALSGNPHVVAAYSSNNKLKTHLRVSEEELNNIAKSVYGLK